LQSKAHQKFETLSKKTKPLKKHKKTGRVKAKNLAIFVEVTGGM
jgi:hypothetical protein